MTITPSKTIYPVQTHPSQWLPAKNTSDRATNDAGEPLTAPTPDKAYEHTRWTVNRSPFVYGRHQDQFEIRTYKRSLELYDADTETVKRWLHYVATNLPFGVGVDYALHEYEPIPTDTASSAKQTQQ
jgi:ribosomal protein S10